MFRIVLNLKLKMLAIETLGSVYGEYSLYYELNVNNLSRRSMET